MNKELGNKDLHFKGQQSDETVIAFFRPHWITLFPLFLIYGLIITALTILLSTFYQPIVQFLSSPLGKIPFVIILLLMCYGIHYFFVNLMNNFLNCTIFTNKRIVEIQKVIFIRDQLISHSLRMIQDVEKNQEGIWKNLLSWGEIIIKISTSDVRVIRFVPNPNFHFRLLARLKLEINQGPIEIKDTSPKPVQTSYNI